MRVFAPERDNAIKKVGNSGVRLRSLLPRLASNVAMVKKANGKWKMCVNFTDLNKACPKDSYHLPHIDQLVDQ